MNERNNNNHNLDGMCSLFICGMSICYGIFVFVFVFVFVITVVLLVFLLLLLLFSIHFERFYDANVWFVGIEKMKIYSQANIHRVYVKANRTFMRQWRKQYVFYFAIWFFLSLPVLLVASMVKCFEHVLLCFTWSTFHN